MQGWRLTAMAFYTSVSLSCAVHTCVCARLWMMRFASEYAVCTRVLLCRYLCVLSSYDGIYDLSFGHFITCWFH
jgi:hypothetical protein